MQALGCLSRCGTVPVCVVVGGMHLPVEAWEYDLAVKTGVLESRAGRQPPQTADADFPSCTRNLNQLGRDILVVTKLPSKLLREVGLDEEARPLP